MYLMSGECRTLYQGYDDLDALEKWYNSQTDRPTNRAKELRKKTNMKKRMRKEELQLRLKKMYEQRQN